MNDTKTVIFITGAFVSHKIWDNWVTYFEKNGYKTLVPPWPFKDDSVPQLREKLPKNAAYEKLSLAGVINHYAAIVNRQTEKPIVIGHSLGGLIVQILVNRNLVSSGIAIHSVPPKGVFSFEWKFLKSIISPLGVMPFAKKTYQMPLAEWCHAYTNGLDAHTQTSAYETYCIPESRRVMRDCLSSVAKVDFNKPHPPLLFINGSNDNLTPNSLNYENFVHYNKMHSVTDYKEFKGRNHFVLALPTWQEEADYILQWLDIIYSK